MACQIQELAEYILANHDEKSKVWRDVNAIVNNMSLTETINKNTNENTYEVSTKGDKRFSALVAKLKDGRTIEEAYQLDVKGYRTESNDWRYGKGKPPKNKSLDMELEYQKLWDQWAYENPKLIQELKELSKGKKLTDQFAKPGTVSQASALTNILKKEQQQQEVDIIQPSEVFTKNINKMMKC